jgi:hypothetical protein
MQFCTYRVAEPMESPMIVTSRRRFMTATAAAAGLTVLPRFTSAADCPLPPSGRIVYRVRRNGDPVGEHVATFARDGPELRVTNDIELVVTVIGIPVYRYEHRNEEIWRHGILQSASSRTNKDGKKFDLTAERRDGTLHVEGRKGKLSLDGDVLTTSLWHPDTPKVTQLLDIEDGVVKDVRATEKGRERVSGPRGKLAAWHYRINGDMTRDLWYGDECRLLRVAFDTSKDGSRITLEPTAIEA